MKTIVKKQPVWETAEYYRQAHEAGKTVHPGLLLIKESAKSVSRILEVGCGEGSKLNVVTPPGGRAIGIDISETAIKKAKQQYPGFQFRIADAQRLPFADGEFDLVFSAFTLEHLENPERVLQEMIRVLQSGGILALLAPNYGAPNRASPCYRASRVKKLLVGLGRDWYRLIRPHVTLEWQQVTPKARPGKYEIDWDTTVEPYVGSLVGYLNQSGIKPEKVSSFWGVEPTLSWGQRPLAVLGNLRLYPFKYWGPHLLVIGRKQAMQRKSWKRRMSMAILLLIAFLLPLTVPLLLLGAGIWVAKRVRTNR